MSVMALVKDRIASLEEEIILLKKVSKLYSDLRVSYDGWSGLLFSSKLNNSHVTNFELKDYYFMFYSIIEIDNEPIKIYSYPTHFSCYTDEWYEIPEWTEDAMKNHIAPQALYKAAEQLSPEYVKSEIFKKKFSEYNENFGAH